YRAATRMLEPARHLARCRQQKRVAAGNTQLDYPELLVVELRIAPDFTQVAAHQRQLMLVVHRPQLADSSGCREVTDAAAEGIARVGRIGDDPAAARNGSRLADKPGLGVDRMNRKVLRHRRRRS